MKLLKFLFPNGFGTRGVITIMLVGTLCWKAPIEALIAAAGVAMGYYFKSRTEDATAAKKIEGGNGST